MLTFGENEGLSFQDNEIPSILGFKGTPDPAHNGFVHIRYKTSLENRAPNSHNRHFVFFPVDITCCSQLIVVYLDIIEYQHVGDSRASILKIIESERRLRNCSLNTIAPVHHKTFTNLDYKRLLSNNIQSIKVELRSETGKLIPSLESVKLSSVLSFRERANWWKPTIIKHPIRYPTSQDNTDKEEAVLEHWLLASDAWLARRIIWPAAKRIGRELLVQGAPEIAEFATKKKTAKQAIKSTVAKTVKKNN